LRPVFLGLLVDTAVLTVAILRLTFCYPANRAPAAKALANVGEQRSFQSVRKIREAYLAHRH